MPGQAGKPSTQAIVTILIANFMIVFICHTPRRRAIQFQKQAGSNWHCRPRLGASRLYSNYFKRMSFLTDVTPPTPRVTFMAVAMLSWERTKPLNWTIPLKVSTLISLNFKLGSLKIAALTLVVITLSSMYWPVLSCFGVEAQPTTAVNMSAAMNVETILRFFILIFLGWRLNLYPDSSLNCKIQKRRTMFGGSCLAPPTAIVKLTYGSAMNSD
jgi:hypothetical protein